MTATGGPSLPDLLYSGFFGFKKKRMGEKKKAEQKVLSEVLSLEVQFIERRDFSGFQRQHRCQCGSFQVSLEGFLRLSKTT